jgi:integrase
MFRKKAMQTVSDLQKQMVELGAQFAQMQAQLEHAKREAQNKRGHAYTVVQGRLGSQADINKLIASKKIANYNDGNGLSLDIKPKNPYGKARGNWKPGDPVIASWLIRWTQTIADAPPDQKYKSRCIGFGSAREVPVEAARKEAIRVRELIRAGIDPLQEKADRLADAALAQERFRTVYQVRDEYLEKRLGHKSLGYQQRARQLLDDHILNKPHPTHIVVGNLPMQKFTGDVVLKHCGFAEFWKEHTPSAIELKRFLYGMYALAKYNKYYIGYNPMSWEEEGESYPGLKSVLPSASEIHEKKQHPYLLVEHAPAFVQQKLWPYRYKRDWHIIGPDGRPIPGYALEWAVLTGVRIGEVIKARWEEIDIPNLKWNVPPNHLKKKRKNGQPRRQGRTIPITTSMLRILRDMQAIRLQPYNDQQRVFPLVSYNRQLKTNDSTIAYQTVRRVLRMLGFDNTEVSTHGFRSTLKNWVLKERYPMDWWRIQVDHELEGSMADRAYGGEELLEERRRMMQQYDNFLNEPPEPAQSGGNVVYIDRRA